MVRYIGIEVFIRKYTKLNVFLIFMHKSKTTFQNETDEVYTLKKKLNKLCSFLEK